MPPKLDNDRLQGVTKRKKQTYKKGIKYVCGSCTKGFRKEVAFNQHIKTCKQVVMVELLVNLKPTYDCKECSKKYKYKENYDRHVAMEHAEGRYSKACDECPVRCPNASALKEHKEKVHSADNFECEQCSAKFTRRAHVLRHLAQKGCGGKAITLYSCEICYAKFPRKDNLMVHLRTQHIAGSQFNCNECSFNTNSFSKFVAHKQKTHSVLPLRFECDICGKSTGSRIAMIKHLEIHGNKKYICDVCGYSTYSTQVIQRHTLTHVDIKPFQCSLCDRSFIQRKQLKRHVENHHEIVCPICDLRFTHKSQLKEHQQEHEGEPTWACNHESCRSSNYVFANAASYKAHIKKHHDVEKYKYVCEICDKRYNDEMNLRRHMTTHTLDRPRRCMYCVNARAYVRGDQLLKHVRKIHPQAFSGHLSHVRTVMGVVDTRCRVSKSELDSILNILDAEADRILQGYSGTDVLYAGMQEPSESIAGQENTVVNEQSTLMGEAELAENLKLLLSHLINKNTLSCFGWPHESVDDVLEKVIEQCGGRPADRERWTRVQRLRENAKLLFLYAVEDKIVTRMLETHTIDQVVQHILAQVVEPDDEEDKK